MSLSRVWTASWICFMFGSKELPYPGCVLISFLCDYDNKNLYFFYFLGFLLIFQFCLFWLLSKFGNMVIWLYSSFYLLCMLIGPEKKSGEMFFYFYFFNKIQDGRRITCYSEELELLHRFVPRKQLALAICWLEFGVIPTSHFHVVYIKIWWQYCISL